MITRRFFVVGVVATLVTACDRPGSDEDAFRWTQQLPPGAVLHVLNGSGDVTVRPAAGNAVVITGSRAWRRGRASDIRFAVTQKGSDYYVCAMWRGSGKCGARGYRGARSTTFLTMLSLFHRSSDATATFVAEVPSGIGVDGQTANGAVDVSGVTAGVRFRAVNGSVRATNVSGPLSLSTVNGDVHVSADSLASSDSIHLSTTNGGIYADLPASLQGMFDLSVMNGSVHSDFPIAGRSTTGAMRHLTGQIGSSNRLVRMKSMNGNVVVTARGGAPSH